MALAPQPRQRRQHCFPRAAKGYAELAACLAAVGEPVTRRVGNDVRIVGQGHAKRGREARYYARRDSRDGDDSGASIQEIEHQLREVANRDGLAAEDVAVTW